MKSYASVDHIEGIYACCEVELISIEKSLTVSFLDKEVEMMDVDISLYAEIIEEGDILVVEHDMKNIVCIYAKDDEEKVRRQKALIEIIE